MERKGNLPGGVISEVMNVISKKIYAISTAPEIGQDYWSTVVLPMIERKRFFGLFSYTIPDVYHPIVTFIRNRKSDAHKVHAEVRHVVISINEESWIDEFPSPSPPEGYSDGARKKLRDHLGDDVG